MNFLTIDEVIAAAAADIGNPSREEKMLFGSWIWRAEERLRSYRLKPSVEDLVVFDLVARKPPGFISTIDISLIDNDGNDVQYEYRGYNKRLHPITDINTPRKIDIYEDDHCFHLGSTGSEIDCVRVKYESLPIDENGNLMIPASHLEAVSAFIKYMHSDRIGAPESKILRYERSWKIQSTKARGDDKMPSSLEGRQILDKWMSLIPRNIDLNFNTY